MRGELTMNSFSIVFFLPLSLKYLFRMMPKDKHWMNVLVYVTGTSWAVELHKCPMYRSATRTLTLCLSSKRGNRPRVLSVKANEDYLVEHKQSWSFVELAGKPSAYLCHQHSKIFTRKGKYWWKRYMCLIVAHKMGMCSCCYLNINIL